MKLNLARIGLSMLVVGSVLLSPRSSASEGTEPQEEACVLWDLTYKNWLYQASAGGYGTIELNQDADGSLTGSYWNQAVGGGGTLTGYNPGGTFGLHSSAGESLEGTVSPDGTKIGGPLRDGPYVGGWKADGVATCLIRQPAAPPGSASCQIAWGEYTFNGCTTSEPVNALQEAQQATMVVTINSPGRVTLTITARFYGTNLPPTITVVTLVNGEETAIGQVTRVSQSEDSAGYRGIVTIPATGLAPGVTRTNDVQLIDPNDPDRRVPVIRVAQFLIDPAGNIYDADTSQVIEGATVTCYQKQGPDWIIWPAEYFSQTNPLVSDDQGHYAWMTDPGDFKVKATMPGYLDGWGGPVTVPPEVTDLHIYLAPTMAPAPEASGLWISDQRGLQQESYMAGEHLQIHFTMTGTESSDVEMAIAWTTTDPDGQVVSDLSGSEAFNIGPFAVDPKISIAIPPTAAAGWYMLRTEVTYEGQTRFLGTQFLVETTHPLFLPLSVRDFRADRPGWNTIITEGFEGAWPGSWEVWSDSQTGGYQWDKRTCRPHQGANSGWAVGGGRDGSQLACWANYPNGVTSWMVYGPFSLENATAADLTFQIWLRSEQDFDELFWGASVDADNFFGSYLSGDSGGWREQTLDLANVSTLGSLLGQSEVWIALVFVSDSSNNRPEGAYVDDIVLRKHIGSQQALQQPNTSVPFGAGANAGLRAQPAMRSRERN